MIFKLMMSWSQPFIMQEMPEFGFPFFIHHSDGSSFSEDELICLHKNLEVTRKEHNRKAAEYNEKNSKEKKRE